MIRFISYCEFSINTFIRAPHSLDRDISIEITGLGVLDWLVSSIATWIVSLFNDQIISALDSQLQQYISGILPFVDPSKFFG
jgi:hypothetical protein